MVTIVLVEPKNPGNIGFVARAMKNFGFSELILINPSSDWRPEAERFAKHAGDVLAHARVRSSFTRLQKRFFLIGTTSQIGSDDNIARTPISLSTISETGLRFDSKTALVFGREGDGLSNQELALCDSIITIPTSTEYPVLNLSHAVAIVLYELQKQYPALNTDTLFSRISGMQPKQRDRLYHLAQNVSAHVMHHQQKQENIGRIFKKMIARSGISKRESFSLLGFFKKLDKEITEKKTK